MSNRIPCIGETIAIKSGDFVLSGTICEVLMSSHGRTLYMCQGSIIIYHSNGCAHSLPHTPFSFLWPNEKENIVFMATVSKGYGPAGTTGRVLGEVMIDRE